MVSTELFGRGIDIERVNIVINYDMPDDNDSYLHRAGRAGRFGTKGLEVTFVCTDEDANVLVILLKTTRLGKSLSRPLRASPMTSVSGGPMKSFRNEVHPGTCNNSQTLRNCMVRTLTLGRASCVSA